MTLPPLTPRKALNKAFLKVKPSRSDMETFKGNLVHLLDQINEAESEEFHKNIVSGFLKNTYYGVEHYINTKGRNDLVIHNGKDAKSSVGVIVEAKKPANKAEMLRRDNINTKAFQELVLYYLRESVTLGNKEIKYLVATNIYEWFVFDAQVFERCFSQNKELVKKFTDFEEKRLADTTTDFFYKTIAEPAIAAIGSEIVFTWFDIREYEKPLRNTNKEDDNKLIALYKLLSPEHLLKLPFANDSNSLDKTFYAELLHIIGLTETKEGGKKLIERKKEGERNAGSLLENAIEQLDSLDKIARMTNPGQYGDNKQERLFNVGLELIITWVNRVLFLKLLEAQLISYHKGDKSYAFLNLDKVHNFDDLNSLFFGVLARKPEERNESMRQLFANVPYLNSSLFEIADIEDKTIVISNLHDEKTLPVLSSTVLKNNTGKRRTGELNTLEYLFTFLSAYDFSSEGSEEIQEDNKTLINASVLGLIFEKINGYKDGSFFTPGFITMYMCRETIRRAVLQKINEAKGWQCADFDELYNNIGGRSEDRAEANALINSLKICDPAVGSGHFLVSALNEIIAVKSDLRILCDREGRWLKEYSVEVVNDELAVTDGEGELFEYNPRNRESQRVQETLFHEKQTIIENCLFGVDINPNSVKICRLRLWIELLKNAYYKADSNHAELETLPNIDINIKCGNSLISRFALDADLKKALRSSKWTMDTYRIAVRSYQNAADKDEKRSMERLINDIKSSFRNEIGCNDPKVKRLNAKSGELYNLLNQQQMFELSAGEKKARKQKQEQLEKEINQLSAEIEEIKSNRIYENAFEWRFEFPEALNDDGDFVGFDVVIGNPPYIRQEDIKEQKPYLKNHYTTYTGTADLYVFFVERGMALSKYGGHFNYILPNKWLRAGYGINLRIWIKQFDINSIVDFGDLPVFEEATTYPCLLFISKSTPQTNVFDVSIIDTLSFPSGLCDYALNKKFELNIKDLLDSGWMLADSKIQKLLAKIKSKGISLEKYVDGKIFRGVLTGLNEAFVIDEETKNRLITEDAKSRELIKPFLAGRDVKRYTEPESDKWLIFTKRGIDISQYPAIHKHLILFKDQLEPRPKEYIDSDWKGRKPGAYKWYEIQDAVDYYLEFDKDKIVYPNICKRPEFTIDTKAQYTNQKCFIITSFKKSLVGLLNSKLMYFMFKTTLPMLRGEFYEPSYVYLKDFPIIEDSTGNIENLVNQILSLKKQNPATDTTVLESEIDRLVYDLYGLTEEEVKIVEGETDKAL